MVEREASSRSHYLPPSVESILGSEDEGHRSVRIGPTSAMKRSRRRHRQSTGSTSSSSIPEQPSPPAEKAMPKSNTSRKLSVPDILDATIKKVRAVDTSDHVKESQTLDHVVTAAIQAKERTGEDKATPRAKRADGVSRDRPSYSSSSSSTTERVRSQSESIQPQNQAKSPAPNVFSFMESSDSQNVNTVYWQRQEWLRRQAEHRANTGNLPHKIMTSERPQKVASPSVEKRESPVSSDSGIGLESELADIPEAGLDEAPVDEEQLQRTTARAAFAPLLRGISQRSAQRPRTSRSEPVPLDHSVPIPRLEPTMPVPRPIIHHFRPDLSEQASPAIRPRSAGIDMDKAVTEVPLTKRVVSGYEHFASKLSAFPKAGSSNDSFCPIYRRFDSLNQRLFLHLQDEIVEIEDELRQIDAADARLRAAASSIDGQELPESRRFGANAKVDVLGRAFVKLGQYNQALLSYNKLIQKIDIASPGDVDRLKSWLKTENPVKNTEARFLDHHDDLLALCKRTPAQPASKGMDLRIAGSLQGNAAIKMSIILLLSMLAFRLVSSILGRLLIVGACALISLVVHQPASSESGEFNRYLVPYIGFMTIASVIIK